MKKDITVIRKIGGYCVVPREVAHCLRKEIEALGLYSFLLSLPDGWEFKKSWLKNETGLGINKLNRLLRFLKDHNLINTVQRKEKGKFAEFEMEIYDGSNFDRKDDLKPLFDSPSHRNRATETVATEMEHKRIYNKKTDNKERAMCSPEFKTIKQEHPEGFKPSSSNTRLCIQRGVDPDIVIPKFIAFACSSGMKSADWQASLAKWILDEKLTAISSLNQQRRNEPVCTVKEWGPGHPDWERQHA